MTTKILHIILLLGLTLSACKKEVIFPSYDLSDAILKVKAPDGLTAGSPLVFYVSTKEKEQTELTLVIHNGLSTQTYKCYNNLPIILSKKAFIQAGLYTISVQYKEEILVNKKLRILADKTIDPLEVYTGPSTILVGAKQPSMVTTIPADQYDNGISYEDRIHFESDKDKGLNAYEPITNLYSSLEFTSDRQSKKILLGVSKNQVSSTEQTVYEIPDWGSNFKIELIDQYPYADNRQYTKLRTSRIYDQHNNQIADGTLVTFEIYDTDKIVGLYKAIVIDGVANIYIKNPAEPSSWMVRGSIGLYSHSEELKLSYKNNLQKLIWEYDDFQKTIKVGPLRSVLGQYVPDGTTITLNSKGKAHKQETYDGYTTFKLVELDVTHKEEVQLNCSGLKAEIQL